ncbi:MAG: hypothetical protein K2Q06_16500 [Parvularculaceae bacterium]|nr:hypothetical protein [Parvularculaceae bacterium]
MNRTILLLLAAASLAACGQGGAEKTAAANHAAAPQLPPFNPEDALSIQSVNACYLDATQVGEALGTSVDKGAPIEVAPEMRTCVYKSDAGQIRVNVAYIEPKAVDAYRARNIPGAVDYVAGDADHAAFQVSEDGTTCAVLFMRANLSYETRLMSCKGVDGAKDKLLKLPRPD